MVWVFSPGLLMLFILFYNIYMIYIYISSVEAIIKTIGNLSIVNEIRCEIDNYGDVLVIKIMLESCYDEFL